MAFTLCEAVGEGDEGGDVVGGGGGDGFGGAVLVEDDDAGAVVGGGGRGREGGGEHGVAEAFGEGLAELSEELDVGFGEPGLGPEQPTSWLRLPVNSTVPGSTVCQQLRSKGMILRMASVARVANESQSRPLLARLRISLRRWRYPTWMRLDVGGGTGSWSIAAARRHAHLSATVFELPVVAEIARQRIAAAGLGERVDVKAGDVQAGRLPAGHDVFLLANLIHYWSPAQNLGLLKSVRAAAERGARLLLADFWTNRTHTEPMMAALMAGEFAAHLKDGDVYSVDEIRQWLPEAGWRFVEHKPLSGPVSLVVAEAV